LDEVTVFTQPLLRSFLAAGAAAGLLAACGGDETTGTEDHTPVRYEVLMPAPADGPFEFVVGETVRVQLKFFNAADEDLDDVESSHFGGLTFNPTSVVTVARVIGHNYQFDVTGTAEGSGTVTVGYGHDEAADEQTFPAANFTVVSEGGGNPL
jgi:hypothetical protein